MLGQEPRDHLASEHLFSTLPRAAPVALELAAEPGRLRLLARAWDDAAGRRWRRPSTPPSRRPRLAPVAPDDDPARPAAAGEAAGALAFRLRDPEHYLLRTYERRAAEQQGDPLAVLVRAMQGVGPGERLLLRLTLAAGRRRLGRALPAAAARRRRTRQRRGRRRPPVADRERDGRLGCSR